MVCFFEPVFPSAVGILPVQYDEEADGYGAVRYGTGGGGADLYSLGYGHGDGYGVVLAYGGAADGSGLYGYSVGTASYGGTAGSYGCATYAESYESTIWGDEFGVDMPAVEWFDGDWFYA